MELNRRSFLKGGLALSAAAVGGALVGCSPQESSDSVDNSEVEGTEVESFEKVEYEIAETLDYDLVIVGSGTSGLSAAVQAGESGLKAVVLEKLAYYGGNVSSLMGMAAINSPLSIENGVTIDLNEMLQEEASLFNYENDMTFFGNTMRNSADNIVWLQDKGVYFSGLVDEYTAGWATMHYTYDYPEGERNITQYGEPMLTAAEAGGVEVMLETPAVELVQEEEGGAVSGVIAQREDGTYIQINCKNTIIATGGWQHNAEMMAKLGHPASEYICDSMPGTTGDGWTMMNKAGAHDLSPYAGYVDSLYFADMSVLDYQTLCRSAARVGNAVWFNKAGLRFCDESCGAECNGLGTNAMYAQEAAFSIFDQKLAEEIGIDTIEAVLVDNKTAGTDLGFKVSADTLDEIADKLGLDKEVFTEQMSAYNEYCATGEDLQWGKGAENLRSVDTPPFYAFKLGTRNHCSIGGTRVNYNMQVCDDAWSVIEGLYAVGVDSNPTYVGMYNYATPGASFSYCVDSGRTAVKHIVG